MKSNVRVTASGVAAGALAAMLLAAPHAASAQAAAQPALTQEEAQQLQSELQAIRAESEAAKAAEARREQQIDALERRLQRATGVAPTQGAAGQTEIEELPPTAGLNPEANVAPNPNERFEIYGFAQTDYIQDFDRVDPSWSDTLRPSKIPTQPGQFGSDGQSLFSIKQSRLGFQGATQLLGQPASFKFEFDLYGVGVDAGQTTIRIRHVYGTWGPVLFGQTNSLFMDGDIFPNVIDYWGPAGMVFLRNPQFRWTIVNGAHNKFSIAVEKSGNDADAGVLVEVDPSLSGVRAKSVLPDFTAQYRYTGNWGHLQIAGILRDLGFETVGPGNPGSNPKGDVFGWGIDVTGTIKTWGTDKILAGVVYGQGIANYMNDGGTDLAADGTLVNAHAEAVPLLGLSFYYDHYWNKHFSTSLGWSETRIWNTSLQAASAFNSGQYASVNLLWTPDPRLLFGGELLWGSREDNNGATGADVRMQFSAKYSFTSKDWFQ
jgi:DcaP outer membrane protein